MAKTKAEWNAQLLEAARDGDVNLLREALANGAYVLDIVKGRLDCTVNVKGRFGCTALILASNNNHPEIVKALIDAGADVNLQDKWDNTALIWASSQGHTEIVKALLAAGAKIELQTDTGSTALKWANRKGHTEIVELLEKAEQGIRPTREEAGFPPPTAEQAQTTRSFREAELIRKNVRDGKTDPAEVGF